MMKNIILNVILLIMAILISPLMAGGIHAVVGTVQYSDGTFPDNISWNAYITSRPEEVLSFNSADTALTTSMYDSVNGSFLLQCSKFTIWSAGDTVHMDLNDNENAMASISVVLSYDPWDAAGTVVLQEETGIGPIIKPLPEDFQLMQNYPNPFNPETVINFQVFEAQDVSLNVFNSLGQTVRSLVTGFHQSGEYSVVWDGRNDFGHVLPSGVYIYILSGNNFSKPLKAVIIK